ncbi:phosphoenolpyruvate--protein phosphotransferase [Nocardioidaceae bacterium]|nr:phosphoenolpyruvate--protein phosphotransferase [Nocardioidaceae bacterium]
MHPNESTEIHTGRLTGTPVVPGTTLAPVLVVRTAIDVRALKRFRATRMDLEASLEAYDEAVATVHAGLLARAELTSGSAAGVLTATAGLVRDKGLRSAVRKNLVAGHHLMDALEAAVEQFATLFTQMGGLMAERVTDLRDINRRLLARLAGQPEPGLPVPEVASVMVAEDLAPADTAGLDPTLVAALVTERGGPTSHTAIIARQLGIPCVVAAAGVMELTDGTPVMVDGTTGEIVLDPDPAMAEKRIEGDRLQRAAAEAWTGPGRTADGTRVEILANVADASSAASAAQAPVEGVGLFRTELCFLDRKDEPDVAEQTDVYARVLEHFVDADHVVVRTLDAGSDKPVAFATHEGEENPALGVRGLRLSFSDPGLLERQVEAIAGAASRTDAPTWVMAPMVATVAEARDFATVVRGHGLQAGVMVEVPSAALLAPRILAEVDFLSIGTNDLTQYAMAADRMAGDLAHLTDPWQPAVLRLIEMTARAGREAGKPVGVCGEAAADPLLAAVMVGMGVTSLSMAAAAVRPVGARLASVTDAQCAEAAKAALEAGDPTEAREAVRLVLDA